MLLSEESLAGLSSHDANARKALAESLLHQLNRTAGHTLADIERAEEQLMQLLAIYFPDNAEYMRIMGVFIAAFEEHTVDNIRIMLHVLISGHSKKMEELIQLLLFLEPRDLLSPFYTIYYQYAHSILSVSNCLDDDNAYQSPFIDWALQTPAVPSKQEGSTFDCFFLHLLLFTAKHAITPVEVILPVCRAHWQRLYLKCLRYVSNQGNEAELLMRALVDHFISSDGLSTTPVWDISTLFDGLDVLINNAIAMHTLHEQLTEMRGLSLLYLDAPYAVTHNGFKVVCQEMALHSDAMNPITRRYAVSQDELTDALKKHQANDLSLKTMLFRYLGTQIRRENLVFYRNILARLCHDSEQAWLNEMVMGYFILTTTGSDYVQTIDPVVFSTGFHAFIAHRNLSHSLITTCVQDFLAQYDKTPRDVLTGSMTLWDLCDGFSDHVLTIPPILAQKFQQKERVHFLLLNREAIALAMTTPSFTPDFVQRFIQTIIQSVIHDHCTERSIQHEKLPYQLLTIANPKWNSDVFLTEIVKIESFIRCYTALAQRYRGAKLYLAFKSVFQQRKGMDAGLALAYLLTTRARPEDLNINVMFLTAVASRPRLLQRIERTEYLLKQVIDFQGAQRIPKPLLESLLAITETLMDEEKDHVIPILSEVVGSMHTREGAHFWCAHAFTIRQLQDLSLLMERWNMPISFIEWCWSEPEIRDFSGVVDALQEFPREHVKPLLVVFHHLKTEQSALAQVVIDLLKSLTALPHRSLSQLAALITQQDITQVQMRAIMASSSVADALSQFEQQRHASHLERYAFDIALITEQIAHIECLSSDGEEHEPLPALLQAQLRQDYLAVMAYITTIPILVETNEYGHQRELTAHALSERQIPIVFQQLKQKLRVKDNVHHHQIMLLALLCVAHSRTIHQFPRYTQILSLLHSIHHNGDAICEIKTGEGKSTIAALHAVLICAQGRSADIATENNQLASNGLNKFRRLYDYLGVPCGKNIIEAHSHRRDYVVEGVNYSTLANFSLYRIQMRLNGDALPEQASLICDEIDAMLTSTVLFRLAASLNTLFQDTASWTLIYRSILHFINDKSLFITNTCCRQDDIVNLRRYLLSQLNTDPLVDLINRVPDDLLDTLIESALTAQSLESEVDFLVLQKNPDKATFYAAPILDSTKRPDPRISYSDGVQPFLHTLLTRDQRVFELESITETIVIISAKNAFDYYRLSGGRTIGLTGTGGAAIERQEFLEHNGLRVFRYPAFHVDQCESLSLQVVMNALEQQASILKCIQDNEARNPGQPILIIMPSPKETTAVCHYLTEHLNLRISSYHGDRFGRFEEQLIEEAGLERAITVATQSLARGTDIETQHPKGLFVINGCTDVSASDLRQMKGRTARNGLPGLFCSIIRADLLDPDTANKDHLLDRFNAHQQNRSVVQQRERLKTRLLEEVRSLVMNRYFFDLKAQGDRLLRRQCGRKSTLIEQSDFMATIRNFNNHVKCQYETLLRGRAQLDPIDVDIFFEFNTKQYQLALERWLPDDKFQSFTAVEPLIPLEQWHELSQPLAHLMVDELKIVSALLSIGWSYVGHQGMQKNLVLLEQLEQSFEPYFKGKCGLKQSLAETLLKQNVIDKNKIQTFLETLHEATLTGIASMKSIPVLGRLIPIESINGFLNDYITEIKSQIEAEQWDDLKLPKLDPRAVDGWFARLSGISSMLSYSAALSGGPFLFIVNQIILPTIQKGLQWLFKRWFADSESMHVQMLLGLDSILSDTQRALLFFLSISDIQDMTIGEGLDHLTPLLTNKTLLGLVGYFLENNGLSAFTPHLQKLPQYLHTLQAFRDTRLSECLNGKTLMLFFFSLCQLEPVQTALEHTGFQEQVILIPDLTSDFLSTLSNLSIQQFIGFAKLMAHPECSVFLNALPCGTSWAMIDVWLDTDLDEHPIEVQGAIQSLKNYQSNRERIVEDTRLSLVSLRTQFALSTAGLKKEWTQLKPTPPAEILPDPLTPASSSLWIMVGKGVFVLGIVAINIVFFSVPLLITTALLAMMVAYHYYLSTSNSAPVPTPTLQATSSDDPIRYSFFQQGCREQKNHGAMDQTASPHICR